MTLSPLKEVAEEEEKEVMVAAAEEEQEEEEEEVVITKVSVAMMLSEVSVTLSTAVPSLCRRKLAARLKAPERNAV